MHLEPESSSHWDTVGQLGERTNYEAPTKEPCTQSESFQVDFPWYKLVFLNYSCRWWKVAKKKKICVWNFVEPREKQLWNFNHFLSIKLLRSIQMFSDPRVSLQYHYIQRIRSQNHKQKSSVLKGLNCSLPLKCSLFCILKVHNFFRLHHHNIHGIT